ncbi:MAG: hypothetical protein M3Q39_06510, partial [Actinomycetota bacterium]|nr:hypothetical protein [Actinomycetota bacterium]
MRSGIPAGAQPEPWWGISWIGPILSKQTTGPSAGGSLYRDGGAVALRGSAIDREDPSLPESAYSWKVLLHSSFGVLGLDRGVVMAGAGGVY